MNTEEFLTNLEDGHYNNDVGDYLRDHNKLQNYITGYAIDSYLGLHEHNPKNQKDVMNAIAQMMHQVIADFEDNKTCNYC